MSAQLRIIRTEAAPAPVAGAPYNQAVVAPAGELIFVSGQVPVDRETGQIVPGDVTAQSEQVLINVAAVLSGAGATLNDVIKSTVFLIDIANDFPLMNTVYAKHFGSHAPARSTIGVAALPLGARVEIEVVARVPSA